MTIEEFVQKQQAYNKLIIFKTQFDDSKKMLDKLEEYRNTHNMSPFQITDVFHNIVFMHINANPELLDTILDKLTEMAAAVYQLEKEDYEKLLTDFEK